LSCADDPPISDARQARPGEACFDQQMKRVSDAVARLREIESSAGRSDGVVCFARLYREVTEGVAAQLDAHTFQNGSFVEALDLGFAGLFFDAHASFAEDPRTTPRAWLPLFERRARRDIAPLQFALAGMNAHINRDLPVALVDTCRSLGLDLRTGSPEHADYLRVNALLAKVESRVKQSYLSSWTKLADRLLHRAGHVDDVVAMWDVARARDAAWTNGLALWRLRDDPGLSAQFLLTLDRMVGLAGRGLLQPQSSVLGRLRRLFG
jgi:hypothetical protein